MLRPHNRKAMAQATQNIATLHRISRERLSSILLSRDSSKVAVVDVRDEDHAGGHIHNSINVPSSSLEARIPEVIDSLADKEIVIFHCALSQQRGPGAALRYLKERDSQLTKQGTAEGSDEVSKESGTKYKDPADFSNTKELELANQGQEVKISTGQNVGARAKSASKQQVFVLDGGFVKWQEKYAMAECSLRKGKIVPAHG